MHLTTPETEPVRTIGGNSKRHKCNKFPDNARNSYHHIDGGKPIYLVCYDESKPEY